MGVQYKTPVEDRRRDPAKTIEIGLENVEQIWGTQQEIVRLYALGMKQAEIARELNYSEVAVSNVVNSVIGRKRILELQGERDAETIRISERLKRLRDRAVDALACSLESADEKVALKAAEGVLNRTGFAPSEQAGREGAHMSDSHIEALKLLARERGYRTEVIDVGASALDEEESAERSLG